MKMLKLSFKIFNRFNEDDPNFFSAEVRTLVIDFILNRISWGKDQGDVNCVGIQCLLDEGIYKAAYPLHDVRIKYFILFRFIKSFNNYMLENILIYVSAVCINKLLYLMVTLKIMTIRSKKCIL